jgi:hypothetical protein
VWRLRLGLLVGLAISLGLAAGGGFLVWQHETGTRAVATVTECHPVFDGRHTTTECSGSWVVGGSLLAGGHVVIGTIDGSGRMDVGDRIPVTVRGDRAYTLGWGLPIGLLAGGLLMAGGMVAATVRSGRRRALGPRPGTGTAAGDVTNPVPPA